MRAPIKVRLKELGLTIPAPSPAVANAVGAVRTGNIVFVSGHGPYLDGEYRFKGKVSSEVGMEDAYRAARLAILTALGSLQAEIGSLDRVRRMVKVFGMVNSDPAFEEQPKVIDGASDLLVEIFGEAGRHARSAIGVGALPMNIAVEVEMIVEIEDDLVIAEEFVDVETAKQAGRTNFT